MMYVEHEVGHDFIAEQDINHKVERKINKQGASA